MMILQQTKTTAARLRARGFQADASPIGDEIDVVTGSGREVVAFIDARGFMVEDVEVGSFPALTKWLDAN